MDVKSIKKQNAIIFSISCVLSFMMGCYFFSALFPQSTNLSDSVTRIQNYVILTGNTKTNINEPIKLSESTNIVNTGQNTKPKNNNKKPTKSVLGVNAGYEGETTYERVRNQIIKLGVSYEIAEHITWEAYTNTDNPKLFVKNIIGVSMSESSVFKRGLYNNYLGVMSRKADGSYGLKHYETVGLAISDRREMYNRNKRYVRTTPEARLRGNYCASECLYRVSNYNDAVSKLAI